jgi:hypothetical protein
MRSHTKSFVLSTALLLSLLPVSAQALPKPDLYPNAHLKGVGKVRADRDIIECQIQAEDYLRGQQSTKPSTARAGLGGAARGAALGALAGTITKSGAGRGAGAGAAVGGLASVVGSAKEKRTEEREGSPEYRKYVEACLDDMGYRVVGWR